MNKVLLLMNNRKREIYKFEKEIYSYLLENDCQVYKDENDNNLTSAKVFSGEDIDFAIILGGDGTVLYYAHKYQKYDFPYYGINLGRVGCLTEASLDNYKTYFKNIFDGKYHIEKRNVIKCALIKGNEKKEFISFNEVLVNRAKMVKMLLLELLINDTNMTRFYADGVIVSTSTGSSAYNLSSGGPLLLPSAKNFVITPMCPQLRTITSLVVNDTDKVTISFENSKAKDIVDLPVLVIDGLNQYELSIEDKIEITKHERSLDIIKVDMDVSLFEPMYKVTLSMQNLFDKKK